MHGYDKPWAGGAGKNIVSSTIANIKSLNTAGTWVDNEYTYNGITYTLLTDNANNIIGINVNGVLSGSYSSLIVGKITVVSGTSYKLSGCPSGGSASTYRLYADTKVSGAASWASDTGTGADINNKDAGEVNVIILINESVSNKIYYPMVCLSTASNPTTFAPYTNICPISGRTGCSVKAEGKNLLDITYNTVTQDGLTITKLGNGEYDVHGTASANGGVYLKSDMSLKLAQNAAFVGLPSNANLILSAYMNDGYLRVQGTTVKDVGGAGKTVTSIYLWYTNGINYNHVRVKPMLSYDTSISYDNFVPYVTPSQATLSFGTTVYGGQVDFNTGKVRVTKTLTTFTGASGEDWENMISGTNFHQFAISIGTAKNMLEPISNRFKLMDISARGSQTGIVSYSDKTLRVCFKDDEILISSPSAFKTWLASNNLQVCYELATPTELTLTPSMLELLKGYNSITGDGVITITALTGGAWGGDS